MSLNFLTKELRLSKYRLLGLVGQGQFGRVYCATQRQTGHLFALKELDPQRFPTHQFLRELRLLLSLHHPNIVTCHALEHTHSTRYLVLDYCEGGTLRTLMESVRLAPLHSLQLVSDLLAGLEHAHDRGVVHCDIKPENVLLNLRSQGWTARISDFGIARLAQEARFQTGTTGSPAYMAPERFYGQYSYASDLYSVGVLLYELLLGQRPFSGLPAELMSAHLNQPVKVPAHLPDSLQSLLLTALQKLPARRFRSTTEMLKAVQAAAEDLRSTTPENASTALVYPIVQLPLTPCPSHPQETLTAEIRQFGLAQPSTRDQTSRIYRIFDRHISVESDPTHLVALDVRLPEPIQGFMATPQGCFATTQRSIYWISAERFQSQAGRVEHPRLIAKFDSKVMATIDPQGRWLVAATPDLEGSNLSLWRSPATQPRRIALTRSSHAWFQLLTLDSRHWVAASHTVDRVSHGSIQGIRLEVFTRRGTLVNGFTLPIPLCQIGLSCQPDRLIATEPEYPTSLLLLDLKPFRLLRLAVGLVPHRLAAASWGYVLCDVAGQIVLLDRYGQAIGRLDGPAAPSAIALLEPYTLLIATWNAGQGHLHTIDLSKLDLDIVF